MSFFGFGKKKDKEEKKDMNKNVQSAGETAEETKEPQAEEVRNEAGSVQPQEPDHVTSQAEEEADSHPESEQTPTQDEQKDGRGRELTDAESYYFLAIESQDNGDPEAAQQFFQESAQLGYAPAQFQLGIIYENGTASQTKDTEQAMKWYRMAADQDYAAAQFNLGYILYSDPAHRKEGLDWIRRSAQNGDEAADEFLISAKAVVEKQKQEMAEAANRKFLLRELLNRNEIFVSYSTLTNHPFVESDTEGNNRVWLYSSETTAHERAKELANAGRPSTTVRYFKKDYGRLFGELYTLGVNSLRINDDGKKYDAYLYEIAKKKDFSDLPAEKRPIENPKLQLAVLNFLQEFRRKTDSPDPAYRRQLDRNMVNNMIAARYIVPFRTAGEGGGSQIIIMNNNKTGQSFIPIFTDSIEFNRFKYQLAKDQQLQLMASDFMNLARMKMPDGVEGFMLNPVTTSLPLPRDFLDKINKANKKA